MVKQHTNNKDVGLDKINSDTKIKTHSESTQTLFHDNVEILVNGKTLINGSELTINSNTKYFLVGHNGCGKTSLLNYIYSKLKDTIDILLIEQDIKISPEQNIYDFILDANKALHEAYIKYEQLELIEVLTDEQFNSLAQIQEYLRENNWYTYQADAKRILDGLGFTQLSMDSSVKNLSGGWRMRLALGKALLRKPQILLLDEPTNHLDLNAVIWLTDYLSAYKNTLIVVSHQIEFINELVDIIWYIGNPELDGSKIYKFKGSFYDYIQGLKLITKEAENKYDKFSKQIDNLKKKSTPKKVVDEFIKKNNVLRPGKLYNPIINFPDIPTINSNSIIQFNKVDFAYENNENNENNEIPVLVNINMSISMGSRYVLVGPNGSGKTTFFKLCAQLLKPSKGEVLIDERVRIGWFHQQIVDTLPLDLTPIDYLKKIDHGLDNDKCRMYLSKIGLKKQDTFDPCTTLIEELSGGQKSRVAFSAIQVREPNIILMDEPTNHLDIESIQGLINGINEYNGGILLITHDVHLIKGINGVSLFQMIDSTVKYFNDGIEEYIDYALKEVTKN
jgi:ATPase subunit of ABC transporter with duplicated ATPase domains